MPTNTWTPTSGTLWTNILNWSQSRIPITNDYVSISGSTNLPTTGPSVSVTLAGFDTSGITTNWNSTGSFALTNNIVIAAGGVLKIGNPSHSSNHQGWSGDARTNSGITATLFNIKTPDAINLSGCTGGLTISGDSNPLDAITPSPIFLGSAGQSGGTISGIIDWNSSGTIDNGAGGGGNLDVSAVTQINMLQTLNWDDSVGTTAWGSPTAINDYSYQNGPVTLTQLATGTQWYVSTTGSDSNTGKSLSQAFLTPTHCASQMASYDTMNVAAGTYSNGSSSIILPQYSQIIGAGMDITTFTSTSNSGHAAVVAISGCRYYGFTSDTTAALFPTATYPFGCGSNDVLFSNIYVENVKCHGDIDGFFVNTQIGSGTFVNCWMGSRYDCCSYGGCAFTLINCINYSDATGTTNPSRGFNGSGPLKLINCNSTTINGTGQTFAVNGNGIIIGGSYSATSGSGTVYSLNGTLQTYNETLTGATNGTITTLTQAQAIAAESPTGATFNYFGGTITGGFTVSANYPSVLDVRSGAGVGASVGGLSVPLASNVKAGIYFGADANGSTDGSYAITTVSVF